MPKICLSERQKNDENIRRILYKNMGANGMNLRAQLADKLRMNRTTLNNRFKSPSNFSIAELQRIVKLLKIPDNEIVSILKSN